MKKLVSIFLAITFLCSLSSGISFAAKGTESNPYVIQTADDFDAIRDNPQGVYLLKGDITLPDSYQPFEFSGQLIGEDSFKLNAITISGNYPSSTRAEPMGGLFSKISGTVIIKNIRLKGSLRGGEALGGFVGQAGTMNSGSIITNCVNEAEITGGNYVGGIIGMSSGSTLVVSNVTNMGKVKGSTCAGGIASTISKLSQSKNVGEVSGTSTVGGLVGTLYGSMEGCVNSGIVTGTRGKIGGILGNPSGSRTISRCYNEGIVKCTGVIADNDVGGIAGGVLNATSKANLTDCYNTGEVISGSGNFNPILPKTDSIISNAITAENCYYLSEDLEDDEKEGTEAKKTLSELKSGIDSIVGAIEAVGKYNDPSFKGNTIAALGNGLTLFVGSPNAFYNQGGKVNNVRIDAMNIDVTPLVLNGRTLVPARFIAESFGAQVSWEESEQKVGITLGNIQIGLVINQPVILVNGQEIPLDVSASLINSRTLVPLRAIAEALNKDVFWDDRGLIFIKDSKVNPGKQQIDAAVSVWMVSSIDDFAAKISYAKPGDDIVLANGLYDQVKMKIDVKGTEQEPIIIRAQTPGEVILKTNVEIQLSGKHIVFKDFRIESIRSNIDPIVLNRASYCRITGNYFYDIFGATNTFIRCIRIDGASQYNRTDHNVFETTGGGPGIIVSYLDDTLNIHNRVDHNYFKDVPAVSDIFPGQTNGFEQTGAGAAITHDHNYVYMVVEDNLFENIVGDKSETIVSKSSGNIWRYNTFLNCRLSGPDFRCGHDGLFEGNFAINSRIGMRSYGANQVFKSNYFYNAQRGLELTTTDEGYVYQEGSQYRQLKNAEITGNLFIYPTLMGIKFGSGFNPTNGYIYMPENTTMKDNIFFMDRGPAVSHSNSMFDKFTNNKVVISGAGSIGTEGTGFERADMNLVFDGQIYVPEGMHIDKRGLKTYDSVGPENKWWVSLLKNEPDDLATSVKEPDTTPERYEPSVSTLTLIEGETYNLGYLSGTSYYGEYEYSALSNKLDYSVENPEVAQIEGLQLKATQAGNTTIRVNCKNKSATVNLKVVKSPINTQGEILYTKNFDSPEDFNGISDPLGVWKVSNGKLTNQGITTSALRLAVDHSANLTGDFKLSTEVTLKEDGIAGSSEAVIAIGYQNSTQPDYYSVRLGDTAAALNHIFRFKDSISNNIGLNSVLLSKNKTHRVELTKRGDKLIVAVDGSLSGIADVPADLSGKIAFGSTKTAEFDNVMVEKISGVEAGENAPLSLKITRTDEEEVELTYGSVPGGIYRMYRNGIWLYDTTESKIIDDSIRKNIDYTYEIKVYNQQGALLAQGSQAYRLPEVMDKNLFQITDLLVRSGINGAQEPGKYRIRNKGLYNMQRIYSDRVYRFENIPKEFENAAYLMIRNEDMNFASVQDPKTEDFIKFDMNQSATVYVLVKPNKIETIPDWIKNNGWELTGLSFDGFTKIYKKHFEVGKEGVVTVKTGGFESKLPTMYTIMIQPDEK